MARMNIPKKITKYKAKTKTATVELTFENNVDRVNYTLQELIYAANRDVGIFLAKQANLTAARTLKGFQKTKSKRLGQSLPKKAGLSPAFQYFVRKIEGDLQIGTGKNDSTGDTWYGVEQELGTGSMPKYGFMRDTVYKNIEKIRTIQAQYLSAIEDELKAEQLIAQSEALENE